MKTLLLDCDGVVLNCSAAVHSFAQTLLGRTLPDPDDWIAWEHADALGLTPAESALFHAEIVRSNVAQQIDFYPGAEEAVRELADVFDLVFVTAHWKGYPDWVPARDRILSRFNRPIVYTHDKQRVVGDILCDDKAATIEHGGPWEGILFSRPHNTTSTARARVSSLPEILSLHKNHHTKLTEQDVREIRRLRSEGMVQNEIGSRFRLTQSAVSKICLGQSWKHVK